MLCIGWFSTNLQTYRKNHEAKILKGGPRPVQVMNPMSGQTMDVLFILTNKEELLARL